ncbi:uncharacterized protein Z518_01133 [Rhinocladiella mackenziei CBS 650.93]|uniref:Ubiquitin-like 1-activating enzyme E1A n=1 Tax=Rhinocladiella mackenziei CBS 650.93 TaxID=1442369 RepID=A0A0D2G5G6_9EURO|nr:uncharacterized protein Z518_01133 [Rhinocladiella mackenziei CBS 650.93]KIX10052.1 hypothetical protein Z518_01133 [Rhinocladiella mackenziei CBS 650.93]
MEGNPLPDGSVPTDVNELSDPAAMAMNGNTFIPSVPALGDLNGYAQMPDPTFGAMTLPMNGVQSGMFTGAPQPTISADEIALYDRQIRLWGMQVQEKLRGANILLIGMKGLGTEVTKNLVLAGIGTLTILDAGLVTEDDLGTQFFVTEAQIGQNRAEAALPELRKLNPRVELYTDPNPVITKDPEYFQNFDITIATGLTLDILANINMSCRMLNRKFYAADTHGMYGFIFADLGIHDFIVEKPRSNKPAKIGDMETSTRCVIGVDSKTEGGKITDIITYQENYSPMQLANLSPLPAKVRNTRRSRMRVTPLLSCIRALFDFQTQSGGRLPAHNRADLELFTRLANQKHLELQLPLEILRADFLRGFLQNLGSEISPVVAFLGGYLAQDVINAIGQKEPPLQNTLLFDGEDFTASQFSFHPINDDAMSMMNTNEGAMMPEPVQTDGSIPVT